jgi:alpha-beta hydrolase superfamily lysophospholipase
VVYLHGNAGCRLDADDLIDEYLERGISFFSFDFEGSGNSEGSFVTLGHRERFDLECVLDYLLGQKWVTGIALYGRSMGAATALLVASSDRYYHTIAGMVLDSCFASVRTVIRELAHGYVGKVALLPVSTMVESTIDVLRDAVLERAGFDIDQLEVQELKPLDIKP